MREGQVSPHVEAGGEDWLGQRCSKMADEDEPRLRVAGLEITERLEEKAGPRNGAARRGGRVCTIDA
jgi:hypothetical protein